MQADSRNPSSADPNVRVSNGHPVGSDGNGAAVHSDEHAVPADLPEVTTRAAVIIGGVILVLFVALFLLGYLPHRNRQAAAHSEAKEAADLKPIVNVERAKRASPTTELLLPGNVEAYQSTAIYARTSGYLQPLPPGIDIGAEVKKGQLLAEIAAPEVDAELEQSRAALQLAEVTVGRANNEFNLNKATFERFSGLSQTGGVTAQQLDEKRAGLNIATSSLKSAEANRSAAQAAVKRLTEMQGFQKVVAPFDGIVTARNYDAGALISAASGATPGRELFRIEQTTTLRVYINVPQSYATVVKVGQNATLMVRNLPGKPATGKVARTAGALDPTTRTLRVEVEIPNAEHRIFPGMFAQVKFEIRQDPPPLIVPTSALVFGTEGMRIAIVEEGSKIRFRKVILGRDFGSTAEVAEGLTGDEPIVTNPGERLADGVEVQVHDSSAGKPTQARASLH